MLDVGSIGPSDGARETSDLAVAVSGVWLVDTYWLLSFDGSVSSAIVIVAIVLFLATLPALHLSTSPSPWSLY